MKVSAAKAALGIPERNESLMIIPGLTETIFRRYDIRGIVDKSLTRKIIYNIGKAYAAQLIDKGEHKAIVAHDVRLSSPGFAREFTAALLESGIDVASIGMVPTPVAYFAVHHLGISNAAIITGSHNPSHYNGIKLVVDGLPLHSEKLKRLHHRICKEDYYKGKGTFSEIDVVPAYLDSIIEDIQLKRPLKIAVDCGNGIAGLTAPKLLNYLGCEVSELYCDPDGRFPNHHPNPSIPENLEALKTVLKKGDFDIGLAFDGDGDRLGVMDRDGNIIWPDRQMILLSQDILKKIPGATIIFDVKSSTHLEKSVAKLGGKPLMWQSGHALIRHKMATTRDAALGGELSGHLYFNDRWFGFDDALYAAARLLELISSDPRPSTEIFGALPNSINTPELSVDFDCETQLFQFMDQFLKQEKDFPGARICHIDGLRIDYDDGWGLVRASHTSPSLSLRFEADNQTALSRIQNKFRSELHAIKPELLLPF